MNEPHFISPFLKALAEESAMLVSTHNQITNLLAPKTLTRVLKIVNEQPWIQRSAHLYGITKAAAAGYDYSEVESIDDISLIYLRYFTDHHFGSSHPSDE